MHEVVRPVTTVVRPWFVLQPYVVPPQQVMDDATPVEHICAVEVVFDVEHPVTMVKEFWVLYVQPAGQEEDVAVTQLTQASPLTRVRALLAAVLIALVSESTVVKLFFTASSDIVARSNWFDDDVVSTGDVFESLFESADPAVLGAGDIVWNA